MALVLFELPGLCTSAPAASERAGGLYVVLSLRHFGPAAICSLSLGGGGRRGSGAALLDRREPLIFLFSKFRIAPIDGARAVRATGTLHIGAGRERTGRGALRRALAPTFRAGSDLLIIPWRGWAPRTLARRCSTGASR